MSMPVPRETASPCHSGRLHMRLGDLPPGADLAATGLFLFQQLLVWRIDKGVILKKICPYQILGPQVLRLGDNSLIQNIFQRLRRSWLSVTDEIDDVDDPGSVCYLARLAR